jgi:putative phage-type endonuclease
MKKRTPSPVPGSADWIEQRRHGIFATDAATVMGRSPWDSPFTKFQEMLGTTMPKIATEEMEMGLILQPIVGRLWAKKHGRKVRANPWTYWLDDGIGSHFDFDVVPEKGQPVTEILEVKTADKFAARDWGEQDTEQVPEAYDIQCRHEMMCRGPLIERCHLAVLIGGNRFRSYVIDRDDDTAGHILSIERRFLANARLGIAPEMDGSEAATNYLRNLSPRDNGERWELPEPVEELATAFLSAKAQTEAIVEQTAILGNKLRLAMGDNASGIGKLVKVSYKASKDRAVTDWKLVASGYAAEPDYSDCLRASTTTTPGIRPLIVTYIGD